MSTILESQHFIPQATHKSVRKEVLGINDSIYIADSSSLLTLQLGRFVIYNSNLKNVFYNQSTVSISEDLNQDLNNFNVGVAGGSLPSLLGVALIAAIDEHLTFHFDTKQHSRRNTLKPSQNVDSNVEEQLEHNIIQRIAKRFSYWTLFLVDERCVPLDDEDSNYKLLVEEIINPVKQYLLNEYIKLCGESAAHDALDGLLSTFGAIPINDNLFKGGYDKNVPLSEDIMNELASDYESTLKSKVNVFNAKTKLPKFDLSFIGLGPDGHICSLFPNFPQTLLVPEIALNNGYLQNDAKTPSKNLIVTISDSPKPPPQRITFTLPLVNSSNRVVVVTTGSGKSTPIGKTLWDKDYNSKTPYQYPVSRLINYESNIDNGTPLVWFLDNGSGSLATDDFKLPDNSIMN